MNDVDKTVIREALNFHLEFLEDIYPPMEEQIAPINRVIAALDEAPQVMPDKMKPALLPCPFCGGEAVLKSIINSNSPHSDDCWVACTSCRVERPSTKRGEIVHTEAEATAAWNKRAPDANTLRLNQLRAKLAYYEAPLPELVDGRYTVVNDHRFSDDGICVRCGEDAENWDSGCVEKIVNDYFDLQEVSEVTP